jgi:hypothetical protein
VVRAAVSPLTRKRQTVSRYDATASDIQQLLMQLDRMRTEPALRASLSTTGLAYAMEHHSPERVASEYLGQLASVGSLR